MQITFLGHASVLIEAEGSSLVVDPYEPGGFEGRMRYRPVPYEVDYVVCSHAHRDHSAVDCLPGSPALVAKGHAGPFRITRHRAAHDEYGGRRRGGEVDVLAIEAGAFRVVHAGDIGHAPPAAMVDAAYAPDVLLFPIGGYYTVGASQGAEWRDRLQPRVGIPMHFGTPDCDLPLRSLDLFLALLDEFHRPGTSRIDMQDGRWLRERTIVVLEPQMASTGRIQ